MSAVTIIIDGQPVAKGRARMTRAGFAYTPAATRKWEAHGKRLAVDGIVGRNTDAAIKQFQASQGLKADGIIGPRTTAALQRVGFSATVPMPNMRPGGGGSVVPPLSAEEKAMLRGGQVPAAGPSPAEGARAAAGLQGLRWTTNAAAARSAAPDRPPPATAAPAPARQMTAADMMRTEKVPSGPLELGNLLAAFASGDEARIAAAGAAVGKAWENSPPGTALMLPGQLSAYADELARAAPYTMATIAGSQDWKQRVPAEYRWAVPMLDSSFSKYKNFQPPPIPQAAVAAPSTALGASGDDVRGLQELFTSYGVDPGPIDGLPGPKTLSAAQRFMRLQPAIAKQRRVAEQLRMESSANAGFVGGRAPVRLPAGTSPGYTTLAFGGGGSSAPKSNTAYSSFSASPGGGYVAPSMVQSGGGFTAGSPTYTSTKSNTSVSTSSSGLRTGSSSSSVSSSSYTRPVPTTIRTDAAGRILGGI